MCHTAHNVSPVSDKERKKGSKRETESEKEGQTKRESKRDSQADKQTHQSELVFVLRMCQVKRVRGLFMLNNTKSPWSLCVCVCERGRESKTSSFIRSLSLCPLNRSPGTHLASLLTFYSCIANRWCLSTRWHNAHTHTHTSVHKCTWMHFNTIFTEHTRTCMYIVSLTPYQPNMYTLSALARSLSSAERNKTYLRQKI